ncbi:conserved membrane hypothetical protein [uncultured Paludibacter sp.]|uniref:Uncharacterized protein n=1 Tax=uncultured Paludibacter sp. TaxID=497635 RepID=A0A653AKW4_9BACT|nr:conserved membrane hypothetical protein [uncultured Paludibacter sp.]
MKLFNNFISGFIIGLVLPALFIWIYLTRFYPSESNVWEIVSQLYPSILLGKLLMLSIFPDMILGFIFYKKDSFRIASGIITGGILYLIAAIFMM